MTSAERAEMTELSAAAMRTLQQVKACDGFNLGMNAGAVAGAGVAGHVHQHVVPRWSGDSNFLPIVGHARALPELRGQTDRKSTRLNSSHVAISYPGCCLQQ